MLNPETKARLDLFKKDYFLQHPVEEIKSVHRLSSDIEGVLASLAPLVARNIDAVIRTFYDFILSRPRARAYFSDQQKIESLQAINRRSFVRAFTPPFDEEYFASRLQVGYVHYAIDLSPELYVGAIGVLETALSMVWEKEFSDLDAINQAKEATSRMLKVEVQLTLDTYFTLGRQDVEAARKRSQEVLDNLREGFLTIHPGPLISVASQSCTQLFGERLEGLSCRDLPGIDREKAHFLATGIDQYFENFMPLDVNLSLLPPRLATEAGKTLELRYTPILDQQKNPLKLIVTVQDITEALSQAAKLERETQLNRALIQILRQKDAFVDFLLDTYRDLEQLSSCLNDETGRRLLHTLKGNSAAFGLADLAKIVHDIESAADVEIAERGVLFFFQQASRDLREWIDAFLKNEGAVLEIDQNQSEGRSYSLSPQEFSLLQGLARELRGSPHQSTIDELLHAVQMKPVATYISTYGSLANRLAQKLGKKVIFAVEGADIKVTPAIFGPIFKQLVHAIRNAIDHGIESEDDRVEKGKDPRASLTLSIKQEMKGKTSIVLRDDGRGIDRERLVAKALEKGLISPQWIKSAGATDVLGLIFADGVSTAEKISDTSGRGVGMSALRAEVERLGGCISLWSEKDKGTAITILIDESSPAATRLDTAS